MVADLTIEEFRAIIREVVIQTLSEILGDPDEGLELNDDFQMEIQQSLAAVQEGGKTMSARDVAEQFGLTW